MRFWQTEQPRELFHRAPCKQFFYSCQMQFWKIFPQFTSKLNMQFEMSYIWCDQGGRRTLCSLLRRKEGATVVDEEMSSTMLRWQNFVLFLNWLCWLNMVEVANLKTKMLRSWCRNYSLSFPSFSAGPRCQLIFNLENMCWASDGIASAPDRFPSVCVRDGHAPKFAIHIAAYMRIFKHFPHPHGHP